jgi:hypothetical protein
MRTSIELSFARWTRNNKNKLKEPTHLGTNSILFTQSRPESSLEQRTKFVPFSENMVGSAGLESTIERKFK